MAATRQKEMNASIALEATRTRVAVERRAATLGCEFEDCILDSAGLSAKSPFCVCEVSCRARTERCPTVCRWGRPYGYAPSELLPPRAPRSRRVAGFDVKKIVR